MKKIKKCGRCKQIKNISEFHSNKSRYDKVQAICKDCANKIYKDSYSPLEKRSRHIKKYYNIEYSRYIDLLEKQDYKCKLCRTPIKAIGDKNIKTGAHIDHNHKTGEIRGLLCHGCNAALGYFSENIDTMKKAIEYLEYFKHKGELDNE